MRHQRNSLIKIFAAAVLASTAWTATAQVSGNIEQEFSRANDTLLALEVHNAHLRSLINEQESLFGEMDERIEYARMLADEDTSPLNGIIEEMISSLESFIETDLPFEMDERRSQINSARNLVNNEEASMQQKFNRLLDIYRAEVEYANNLGAYDEQVIDFNGTELEVNMVRVGRIALAFQSTDRMVTGYWNKNTGQWEEADPGDYRTAVNRAYRVANSELAPEMLNLPIHAPQQAQ